jgi:hypothetical protein
VVSFEVLQLNIREFIQKLGRIRSARCVVARQLSPSFEIFSMRKALAQNGAGKRGDGNA